MRLPVGWLVWYSTWSNRYGQLLSNTRRQFRQKCTARTNSRPSAVNSIDDRFQELVLQHPHHSAKSLDCQTETWRL